MALPELLALFPGWPGYGIRSFIRWNDPVIAITHVRVNDGRGAPPIEDSTIVLVDGKIQSVGTATSIAVPQGARVLDFSGYTVIPGLVGMHDHLFYPVRGGAGGYKEMGFRFPRLYLAGGVTTIRLAGSIRPDVDLRLKNQIDRGWLAGPKTHLSGPYLNEWISPDQARETVNQWADRGAKTFKAYVYLSSSALSAAIDAAHKRGLKITGHLCAVGFREAVHSESITSSTASFWIPSSFQASMWINVPPSMTLRKPSIVSTFLASRYGTCSTI